MCKDDNIIFKRLEKLYIVWSPAFTNPPLLLQGEGGYLHTVVESEGAPAGMEWWLQSGIWIICGWFRPQDLANNGEHHHEYNWKTPMTTVAFEAGKLWWSTINAFCTCPKDVYILLPHYRQRKNRLPIGARYLVSAELLGCPWLGTRSRCRISSTRLATDLFAEPWPVDIGGRSLHQFHSRLITGSLQTQFPTQDWLW